MSFDENIFGGTRVGGVAKRMTAFVCILREIFRIFPSNPASLQLFAFTSRVKEECPSFNTTYLIMNVMGAGFNLWNGNEDVNGKILRY